MPAGLSWGRGGASTTGHMWPQTPAGLLGLKRRPG
ncbi:hypothetical protein SFR_2460 [Streptomyces sp. FR-008]|nr:hypothetical protein SFR_2460 [Streptomyces sp. FR-008]